ncbi:MAG: hypothetical protein ABJA67_02850, partial [Chthonomonadales bacterium]
MTSPDGRMEVVKSYYIEIRMGSPVFGGFSIRGTDMDTSGRFGEAMAFSCDSRYLAMEELISVDPGPHAQAVIFDLEQKRKLVVYDQNPGFVRGFRWLPDGTLTFRTWSLSDGEIDRT